MKTRFRGGEGVRSLPPGPCVSHPELLGPFIPPPAPGDRLKEALSAFKTKFWVPMSSVPKPAVLCHAPCPATQSFCSPLQKGWIFVTWIYSLSIHKEWGSSQLKTICLYMFSSICQFRAGQIWRMRDFWWEMVDMLFNQRLSAPFLMWRCGRLNA